MGAGQKARPEGDATPVAVALISIALACVLFFSSLLPALAEEKSVHARLRAEERKQEVLRKSVEEGRRQLRGLHDDPQELLRALDEAGIAPPSQPPVTDPRDRKPSGKSR
jgi:hypothetical protein